MAPALLQVLCFLMVASVSAMASKKPFEANPEPFESLRQKPAPSPLLTTLNSDTRSAVTTENTPNVEEISKDENLKESDAKEEDSCPSCAKNKQLADREELLKAARLKLIEELLRDKLNIHAEDSPGSVERGNALPMKLPQAILDEVQDDDSEIDEDGVDAWDNQIMQNGYNFEEQCPHLHSGACYRFDVNDLQAHRDTIQTTHLWLHVTTRLGYYHQRYEIAVYELLEDNTSGSGNGLMGQRLVHHSFASIKDNWLQVDLTEFVINYLLSDAQTLYLAIACETCYRDNDQRLLGSEDGYKPLLITNLIHEPNVREKRSTQQTCDHNTKCCKRHLSVDTSEIGYHSIHMPQTLSIGYCQGPCTGLTHFSSKNAEARYWARTNLSEVYTIQFCCVPTKLRDISVIHWVNGTEHRGILVNAKVAACGCR